MGLLVFRWNVAAAFFSKETDVWIDDYSPLPDIEFRKIVAGRQVMSWHRQKSKYTDLSNWLGHFGQALRAFDGNPEGIITAFPQLAMSVGMLKRLRRSKVKLIAYNFNLGALRGGWRQRAARFAAASIDRFVVHSPTEVEPYADYLGVPAHRVVFVPLQRGIIQIERNENAADPYVLAMGSAHRDYKSLVQAADELKIKTIIVSRPSETSALPHSDHVTTLSGLSMDECLRLLAGARISVTPLDNDTTASGQVTLIDAMMLGVPVIATRCPGTDGYVEDGVTGVLVPPRDAPSLTRAIKAVWDDLHLRERLSDAGRAYAELHCSDEAAGRALARLISSLH